MTRSLLLSRLAVAAVSLYSLGIVIHISLNPFEFQWDFKTYYAAGIAIVEGSNPFDLATLNAVSGLHVMFRYVYPPLTVWTFLPFALLPYQYAATAFLLLKALAALGLIHLWATRFLDSPHWPLFSAFCLFGFNATFYSDFAAGNISVFEQLALWSAFYFFLREQYRAFCALILVVASFKLLPLLFLALLWCTDHPRRHQLIAFSVSIFGASLLLSFLVTPELFASFLDNLDQPAGRGTVNPSSFTFIFTAFERIKGIAGVQVPAIVPAAVYAVTVLALVLLAMRTIRPNLPVRSAETKILILSLLIVTYSLVVPRFKNYSFLLLLVPAYHILIKSRHVPAALLLVLFMIPYHSPLPGLGFLANYSSLFLTIFLFFLYIEGIHLSTRVPQKDGTPKKHER